MMARRIQIVLATVATAVLLFGMVSWVVGLLR
jgi:hypothetical protein